MWTVLLYYRAHRLMYLSASFIVLCSPPSLRRVILPMPTSFTKVDTDPQQKHVAQTNCDSHEKLHNPSRCEKVLSYKMDFKKTNLTIFLNICLYMYIIMHNFVVQRAPPPPENIKAGTFLNCKFVWICMKSNIDLTV